MLIPRPLRRKILQSLHESKENDRERLTCRTQKAVTGEDGGEVAEVDLSR